MKSLKDFQLKEEYEKYLRIYFATNCPSNIPEWFIHDFKEEPKKPKTFDVQFGKYSNHPFKDIYIKYWNDEADMWADQNGEVPQLLKDELKDWFFTWDIYHEEIWKWNIQNKQHRFFQWRIFYADKLIEALNVK